MKTRIRLLAWGATTLFAPLFVSAQMTSWFQWTFLPQDRMNQIIGEVSGETAYGHIMILGGAPQNRRPAEYADTFMEAQYILGRLKEYRLDNAAIVRFAGGETWDAESGELWEVSPQPGKIASYMDLRAVLAVGSTTADLTADLIWVGDGEPRDFEGRDVKGKIVVTSGPASGVHRIACLQKDAEGVISFSSPRPLVDPLMIPWSSINGDKDKPAKFAFCLPPREGILLRDRLRRGESIKVRAKIESSTLKYELQNVVASIPGTDPSAGEIILTAHLFEGFAMQGANDNSSGCAAILEAARTLSTLVREGRLAPPKRTIRFLWAYEGSGTARYVQANKELMRKTLCDINLDMVGLRLTKAGAFFTLMRTSYGNPHYINDIMENFYRFVSETSRTYVTNGAFSVSGPRIVAPSGAEEPMYYYMGTHYGSSDHEIFNDWGVGVPGVVMNTWPDLWLHSSADRPDKLDPTQMKRATVIAAAAAYTIAAADDRTAGQIAAEIVSNASARIGHQLARGLEEMKRADRAGLGVAYLKARAHVEAAAINERATLDTVEELASGKIGFAEYLTEMKASVTRIEQGALKTLDAHLALTAQILGIKPTVPALSSVQKKTATIVPRPTPLVKENGFEGYLTLIKKAGGDKGIGASDRGAQLIEAEMRLLCNGRNSVLDIKKMLDTQFREETGLDVILAHLEILRKAGLIAF